MCTSTRRLYEELELPQASARETIVPSSLLGQAPSAKTLVRWFEAIARLTTQPAYGAGFLQDAARMICDPGGLDLGLIFLRRDLLPVVFQASGDVQTSQVDEFTLQAASSCRPLETIAFDAYMVQEVTRKQCTIYHASPVDRDMIDGQGIAESIVVSPLLDCNGSTLGVIYGSRMHKGTNQRRVIRPLEALWMQMLGASIGGSLLRTRSEREAAQTKTLLEQVFCPEVASKIIAEPEFLRGQSREITLLFADLRDSTALTAVLSIQEAYQFLGEVLDELTNCVLQESGVIVDYHGDGLAAMWNAPLDQADHPLRGARTALAMKAAIDELNAHWNRKLGTSLRLAIGMHTGLAEIGNAGSRLRLKYGPRGSTVNLASRLELAAKKTEAGIVISESYARNLPACAVTRRLGTARFSGFAHPLQILELCALDPEKLLPRSHEILGACEQALLLAENGNSEEALALMKSLDASSTIFSNSFPALQKQLLAWTVDPASQRGTFELDFSSR